MMKHTHLQGLNCRWDSFQIWGVVQGAEIIHLSFNKNLHRKIWAQTELASLDPVRQKEMCAFLLSTLQGTPAVFPQGSPFIQKGTPFQQKVWQAISRIPQARTRTYGEIATELGTPHLARAVGQACKRNPLPLIIPCHRVVSASGMGGFSGGSQIKKTLLEHEQAWLKGEFGK